MPHLRIEEVSVNYRTLDVVQVCEVLECSLQQTSLLTQLSYVSPVIVSKHLVSQDGICNLEGILNIFTQFPSTITSICHAQLQEL